MDDDGEEQAEQSGLKQKNKVTIAEFEEEHRQEMQLLINKVLEMMDLRQCRCWMAKGKTDPKTPLEHSFVYPAVYIRRYPRGL